MHSDQLFFQSSETLRQAIFMSVALVRNVVVSWENCAAVQQDEEMLLLNKWRARDGTTARPICRRARLGAAEECRMNCVRRSRYGGGGEIMALMTATRSCTVGPTAVFASRDIQCRSVSVAEIIRIFPPRQTTTSSSSCLQTMIQLV